jgi:hypothetical protein
MWGRLALGLLVIGGTFVALWAIYRPSVSPTEPAVQPPPAVTLHAARAVVRLMPGGSTRAQGAVIACNGRRRTSTGFWAGAPIRACNALASARGALLAGLGCPHTSPDLTRLHVTGAFGPRRFDLHQQRGGCPDPDGWLAVNVLASPVLVPDRKATDAPPGG